MPKVVWELEVIGDEEKFDTNDEIQLAVNQTLAEYLAEAQEVSLSSFSSDHHQSNDEIQLAVNQTLAEYLAEAEEVSFRLQKLSS